MDIELYRWNRMELNGYFMIFPNFLLGLYGDVRLAPLAHVRIKWGKKSSRLQYFDFSRAMEDGYGYVFETMLLTIAVLLLSSCWLLASTRALAGRKTLRDAAVQCDFSTALYVAPSSIRWHMVRSCSHLTTAKKISELTPWQMCCKGIKATSTGLDE